MAVFEYKVLPAPVRAERGRGAMSAEARFAATLQDAMNAAAADGWEFLRAETLPVEERSGLTGRRTVFRSVLVYRRETGPGDGEDDGAATRAALKLLEDRSAEDA